MLDVQGISPVSDFIVLATGTSARQMYSVAEDLRELGQSLGHPAGRKANSNDAWILVDFLDVVAHLFTQDARFFYDLDSLWGDAKPVKWER